MAPRIANRLTNKFSEDVRFFKTWMSKPKAMGSILPTGKPTAKAMASLCDPNSLNPTLELGPGTGVITRAILDRGIKPENLYSVEFTQEFIPQLVQEFPKVNIIHGDAFQLNDCLPNPKSLKFNSIITALPLLNFPVEARLQLLLDLFDRLEPGRPVVQFSYSPKTPIPENNAAYTIEPLDWVIRNVPPARIWVYRQIVAPN